jgi:hypothetical protein
MAEHSLAPITESEVAALIKRISQLAGSVLNNQEWKSMFAAARHLLPRSGARTMEPAELDLARIASSNMGRVLAALTAAFASSDTYKNNQRYSIYVWIDLVRDFYSLASFTVAPPKLDFAPNILRSARNNGVDSLIAAASTIAQNEPLVVRQLVSTIDLETWRDSLLERLEKCSDQGASFVSAGENEESLDAEEYSDWFAESEDLVALATDFFETFRFRRPADLTRLKGLMDEVPPPYNEEPDAEGDDRDRSYNPDYWDVERMFEDL